MQRTIIFLIASAFSNCLAWIILIPVWQYPDEQAHFAQVQEMAELGKKQAPLSTSREIALSESILSTSRDSLGNNKYTYHPEFNIEYTNSQSGLYESTIRSFPISFRKELVKREATGNPPLYYFLGSLFYKLFYSGSIFERIFAVRLFSSVLFLGLVFTAYLIGKILFENKLVYALSLASLIAFKPMLVFASTGILPDPATNLLFSLVLMFSLLTVKEGLKTHYFLAFIGLIILGSLTRQQFLISTPIILGAITVRIIKERNLRPFFAFGLFSLILLLLSYLFPSLHYLKNLSFPEVGNPTFSLLFQSNIVDYTKIFLGQTNSQTFAWYWGVYRWLSFTLPTVFYQILKSLVLLALIGGIAFMFTGFRKKTTSKVLFFFLIFASLTYISVIALWDYFFRLNHNYSFGLQGRYFFPMVIAHFGIFLTGLLTIWRMIINKFETLLLFVLSVSMIIFNNVTLFLVASSYYDTSSVTIFINQASQYKAVFIKGEMILFLIILTLFTQVIFLYNFAKIVHENN